MLNVFEVWIIFDSTEGRRTRTMNTREDLSESLCLRFDHNPCWWTLLLLWFRPVSLDRGSFCNHDWFIIVEVYSLFSFSLSLVSLLLLYFEVSKASCQFTSRLVIRWTSMRYFLRFWTRTRSISCLLEFRSGLDWASWSLGLLSGLILHLFREVIVWRWRLLWWKLVDLAGCASV